MGSRIFYPMAATSSILRGVRARETLLFESVLSIPPIPAYCLRLIPARYMRRRRLFSQPHCCSYTMARLFRRSLTRIIWNYGERRMVLPEVRYRRWYDANFSVSNNGILL